ncbi:MAG: hypothetical protein C3F11_15225 [Methylocystaceae bacterium]|nr:MAG: hypothetical protein C3F11_15225 [Methylocystaceae bacterium]
MYSCALAAIGVSSAQAASCESNFTVEGVPLVTALSYKTWEAFPKLDPKKALDRLASAVLAEGFSDMKVDKAFGAITALQETSGFGRPQTLRVVARKLGGATRVDVIFSVQAGQVAPEDSVRGSVCRVIAAAAG